MISLDLICEIQFNSIDVRMQFYPISLDGDGAQAVGINSEVVTTMKDKYEEEVTKQVTEELKRHADTKDKKQKKKIELFLWDFGGQASILIP